MLLLNKDNAFDLFHHFSITNGCKKIGKDTKPKKYVSQKIAI